MQTACSRYPAGGQGGGFARVSCNHLASDYYWVVRFGGKRAIFEEKPQKKCKRVMSLDAFAYFSLYPSADFVTTAFGGACLS